MIRDVDHRGVVGFDLNYTLPASRSTDLPTDRQVFAVETFYGRAFPQLTADQARALLAVREYARLCGDTLFRGHSPTFKPTLFLCLAAFVLSDHEMTDWAIAWSEVGYARGSTTRRVRGSPYYLDVSAFADYLDGSLAMQGIRKK